MTSDEVIWLFRAAAIFCFGMAVLMQLILWGMKYFGIEEEDDDVS